MEDISLLCFENGSPGMDPVGGEGEAGAAHLAGSTAAGSGPTFQLATLLDSLQPRLLPQLHALAVDCDALPAGAAAALHQLGRLRTLVLFVRGPPAIPAEVVQTVAQSLSLLSCLELNNFAAPMPDLQQLTQLSGLVELALVEGQTEGDEEAPAGPALAVRQAQPMQPPHPAAFPALEVCHLSSRPYRMQVGAPHAGRQQGLAPAVPASRHRSRLLDRGCLRRCPSQLSSRNCYLLGGACLLLTSKKYGSSIGTHQP